LIDLVRVAMKPMVGRWVASKIASVDEVIRPSGATQVNVYGLDSDRILMIGSGLAVGWGVATQDEAVAGGLARSLADLSGRGADIDVQAAPTMTVDSVSGHLAQLTLRRYDAIALFLGSNESLSLMSEKTWRRKLKALLTDLLASVPAATRVFVVGIQPARSVDIFDSATGDIPDRQAAALNAVSAALCETLDRAIFLPLGERTGTPGKRDVVADYANWAEELSDAMFDPINIARAEGEVALTATDRSELERERQDGVDALAIVDTAEEDRFDRIVRMAQSLYGTESAAFSVIDRDRQWHKSRANVADSQVSRVGSFCSITVEDRGPMVVLNAIEDDRVSGSPQVTGNPNIRFYAGFPVESPNGTRIGALCVFDPNPRLAEDVDPAMLAQLAHLIEAELRVKPTFD